MAENILVKKPHTQESYTSEQLDELAKCYDPDTGHIYFMRNYFFIQHPVKGKVAFEPFDYQVRLIDAYHKHKYVVALLPRQCGKCVSYNTQINLKNKNTGELVTMAIGDFYHQQKNA